MRFDVHPTAMKQKQGASTGRVPIKQYLQKFPINGEDLV